MLPEYLVEFQYELAPSVTRLAKKSGVASPMDLDGTLSQVNRGSIELYGIGPGSPQSHG